MEGGTSLHHPQAKDVVPAMSQYLLHENAYLAECSGTFVFLDLQSDRYIGLSTRQAAWLGEATRNGGPISVDALRFLEKLCTSGLLTVDITQGRPLVPTGIGLAPPSSGMLPGLCRKNAGLVALAQFIPTMAVGLPLFHALRSKPLALTNCVKAWKARTYREATDTSIAAAIAASSSLHSLSPYFISTRDNCLQLGFLLARLLASAQIPFDWVFGVRMAPFKAHCWIQSGGVVLNDSLDHVAQFKPILII